MWCEHHVLFITQECSVSHLVAFCKVAEWSAECGRSKDTHHKRQRPLPRHHSDQAREQNLKHTTQSSECQNTTHGDRIKDFFFSLRPKEKQLWADVLFCLVYQILIIERLFRFHKTKEVVMQIFGNTFSEFFQSLFLFF